MVLSNPNPYSSEEDDDVDDDPWEFVNNLQLKSVASGDATSNESEGVPHDGNVGNNRDEDNAMKGDSNDESHVNDSTESVAGTSATGNEREGDENSYLGTVSEHSDPSIPLNADDTSRNRPDSPDQRLPLPLHQTWQFLTSSLREIDNQNQIRQRTQNRVNKINTSAQNLWTNLSNESQRLATTLQHRCDQADMHAREASQNLQRTMSSTKDNLCRINSEYKIHEKVAAVAAVSGAILVASGAPRAGAGSLLVAGGALAAGEAMSANSERGCSTFTRDFGLREGVHID